MTSTLSTNTLVGDKVVDVHGVEVGELEDIVLNLLTGSVAYGVVSVGGMLGIGADYFAVPWRCLQVDFENQRIQLLMPAAVLENAEGFDKDNWPDFADPALEARLLARYSSSASA